MAGMNITGEQIKDARERRQLTQQELADELGVSLRTVGSWERGESVPRSRMGAIRVVLGMESANDNRAELGRLMNEELEESGRGPVAIVGDWSLSAKRLFYSWKDGTFAPSRKYRGMLEDALGWRRGVVTEILDAPITQTFSLSEVRDWSSQPEPGLVKAKDLTDAELLSELTRRLGNLRAQVDEILAPNNVVPIREQPHYDLAASNEHVLGEDDNHL